jgi:ATP-dependent helicase/nuclease subunit A
MNRIVIPDDLRAAQLKASDPGSSIWVSANAGSGKTHVLTQRVIRLLLRGVPPAKILCLTFTKAAAAQMATRVFDTLAKWTNLDDAALREAVRETGAPAPSHADLLLARRLFTRTVETPGGLKIQTIHAFCERLLHLFPFEANVPARFEVADDLRQATLLAGAKRDAIAEAHRSTGPLGAALARIADEVPSSAIDKLIGEAMRARAPALRWIFADPQDRLATLLGGDGLSVDALERDMLERGVTPAEWPEIAAFFATGSAADQSRATKLATAIQAYEDYAAERSSRAHAVSAYLKLFFTQKGTPATSLMTAGLGKQRPDLLVDLAAEQARLVDRLEARKTAETIERTRALLALVDLAVGNYDERKILHGVLDFDDLIERTRVLLDRSDARWVLHKLDAGIDHVLVDEAQDTSEAQWRILDDLTSDFASGFGARAGDRSFFAVGDDKQSIFSFQGAAPHKFHDMRRSFAKRFHEGEKPFDHVRLKTSFRSVPGVLSAVDKVFDVPAHQGGLVPQGDIWPMHESIKARLPGLVEIWPPVGRQESDDPSDWRIPIDAPDEQDPSAVLAGRIAKKIAALIAPGSPERVHEGRSEQPRAIRAGDVLILVRRRNAFFEAIIRALKQALVPVAGADRLDVANHIAVMDLVAAGRAALLPQDDLTLACLLKSPLFGLSDDDLLAIAPNRPGALIDALAGSADIRHRDAHDKIRAWGRHAAELTPFAFYVALLGRDGGRRQMEARRGPEAHDALDEFLRLALAHERDAAPSLGSFLADIEALQTSIKRDMEGPGDMVRVMTVHAAKGLEAKVVFLPDTCGVPSLQHEPTIFNLEQDDTQPPVLAWSPRKDCDCPAITQARDAAREGTMEEYRRLLYVALTRAEERLYISGFHGARGPDQQCWDGMIATAFAEDPDTQKLPAPWDETETILQRVSPGTLDPTMPTAPAATTTEAAMALPGWLFQPAPAAATPMALRPSLAEALKPAPSADGTSGLAYGAAIHSLLQYLPDVAPDRRHGSALAYLDARADLPATMRMAVVAQALAVLALPELAPLFGDGSKAEVAVIGQATRADGSLLEVRGTVDRLAVSDDTVDVVDYKSGQPHGAASTPAAYITQMALYRLVLAPLWPRKRLRMQLVWTAGPTVVALDDAVLDAAAARALAAP